MSKPIIVYSTEDCVECSFLKKMLAEQGFSFEIRDIDKSEKYKVEVEQYGFLGVPVTVVGERAVKGFNQELIDLIESISK